MKPGDPIIPPKHGATPTRSILDEVAAAMGVDPASLQQGGLSITVDEEPLEVEARWEISLGDGKRLVVTVQTCDRDVLYAIEAAARKQGFDIERLDAEPPHEPFVPKKGDRAYRCDVDGCRAAPHFALSPDGAWLYDGERWVIRGAG